MARPSDGNELQACREQTTNRRRLHGPMGEKQIEPLHPHQPRPVGKRPLAIGRLHDIPGRRDDRKACCDPDRLGTALTLRCLTRLLVRVPMPVPMPVSMRRFKIVGQR